MGLIEKAGLRRHRAQEFGTSRTDNPRVGLFGEYVNSAAGEPIRCGFLNSRYNELSREKDGEKHGESERCRIQAVDKNHRKPDKDMEPPALADWSIDWFLRRALGA